MDAANGRTMDAWSNVLSGLGQLQDGDTRTSFRRSSLIGRETAESIFTGDGLGRKIVELKAEEATRKGFEIEGDDGGLITERLQAMKFATTLTNLATWARLYGGALLVRVLDDGQELDQPLNYNRLRRVICYRVVDRWRVSWSIADLCNDTLSERFGEPEIYTITPISGMQYRVHHSRCCVLDGDSLPDYMRVQNQGWGASCLQGVNDHLRRVGAAQGYVSNILRDFVQAALSVKGLSEMMSMGQDEDVKRRIQILDLSRSILNTMILDADGEQYTKHASSVAGLADLIDRFSETLAAVSGYPVSKLFGRSTGGLNTTGEGDLTNYYDTLQAYQTSRLSPLLEDVVRDHYLASEGPTRGKEPDQWSITWKSLWQETDKERADLRKAVAETDQIYISMGVLLPEEVAEQRFGQGVYSMETHIDDTQPTPEPEPEPGGA